MLPSHRRLISLGALLLLLGAGLPTMLKLFANSMLFYPTQGQSRSPADMGLDYEELRLPVGKAEVEAWWIPGTRSNGAQGSAGGPVLLMFHGNAGTMADRLDNVLRMVDLLGVGVFAVEYPGYGNSTGKPSEKALFAAGSAGYTEARKRAGDRKLIVFGRSLGGAVAIDVASKHPVDALIAESTFTSLPDMAKRMGIPLARFFSPYQFNSINKMQAISVPTLISHGDQDDLIPYSMGRSLYDASPSTNKSLHTVEGGEHNGIWGTGGQAYWQAWAKFIKQF